jgi:hypothetical protein
MLESVRERMATVVSQSLTASSAASTPDSDYKGSKIPIKSGHKLPVIANIVREKSRRASSRFDAITRQAKLATGEHNKSGDDNNGQIRVQAAESATTAGDGRQSINSSSTKQAAKQSDDDEFQMSLLRALDDTQSDLMFLRERLANDFEATKEQLAGYLIGDPAKLNLHECLCNLLIFAKHLKEAADEHERQTKLEMAREKCTLRRSSTISSRMSGAKIAPPTTARLEPHERKSLGANAINSIQTNGQQCKRECPYDANSRASFGGYRPSERRQSSLVNRIPENPCMVGSRAITSSRLIRTSSTCSSMVKSSLSSLSSQATTSANTSDHDDLHDGLMKLLNDTNSRRDSDKMKRISIGSIGRFSGKLIDI